MQTYMKFNINFTDYIRYDELSNLSCENGTKIISCLSSNLL